MPSRGERLENNNYGVDPRMLSPMAERPQCEEAQRRNDNMASRSDALRPVCMQVITGIQDHQGRADELAAAKRELERLKLLYEQTSAECDQAVRRYLIVNLALRQWCNPWTGLYRGEQ